MADFKLAVRREIRGEDVMRALKSVTEAAGLLGISPWTVRGYIRDGKLRPVRLGRRVLLAEDELERLVAQSQGQAGTQPETNQGGADQEVVR
jgi:excisionase family DNA binding protein